MLIGAEGARLPRNARGCSLLERKSTGKFNTAIFIGRQRENSGGPMCNMFTAIKRLVDKYEDIQVVYPVHMNPIVRELANDIYI
jgi:UDP-N-acetylglucosamine 2-epimerase